MLKVLFCLFTLIYSSSSYAWFSGEHHMRGNVDILLPSQYQASGQGLFGAVGFSSEYTFLFFDQFFESEPVKNGEIISSTLGIIPSIGIIGGYNFKYPGKIDNYGVCTDYCKSGTLTYSISDFYFAVPLKFRIPYLYGAGFSLQPGIAPGMHYASFSDYKYMLKGNIEAKETWPNSSGFIGSLTYSADLEYKNSNSFLINLKLGLQTFNHARMGNRIVFSLGTTYIFGR